MEIERTHYPNGNIKSEAHYHRGQQHGKSVGWYENGQQWWERDYHHGQQHGKSVGWHENGQQLWEIYILYGNEVTEEEYRKHQLIIQVAGIEQERNEDECE